MKIAFIYDMIYPFNIGGAELRNYEMAKRLAKNHEVHLFGVKLWDGPDTISCDGIIIHGVCRYKKLYNFSGTRTVWEPLKFAFFLYRHLAKEKFDIIDCSSFVYFHCFTVKLASLKTKSKLIMSWHQFWGDYWYDYLGPVRGFIGRVIEKIVENFTDNHLAMSQTTKRDLIRSGLSPEKIFISYNGVDNEKIAKIAEPEKIYDLAFAGRFVHQKNIIRLIEAIYEMKKKKPELKACLIGDGPEKEVIIEKIKELGLEEVIFMTGFLASSKEVFKTLKRSRVFVLPSLLEGFGIVVIEANACGLPAIVVDSVMSASKELIDNGLNGFLAEDSAEDIAAKVLNVLNDDNLRQKMAEHSLIKAKAFDWDKIAKDLEEYYVYVSK